ncbi:MAG: D-2-hydroxyacid dehydrogenase [Myxococcota bacterium]|nr:D-2-hydroxyacid dehydrogenase [Myxococcota bacterium]
MADDVNRLHVVGLPARALQGPLERFLPGRTLEGFESREDLLEHLSEVEILFALNPPREGWAGAERLRLLHVIGAGVDTLLPSPDLPADVRVSNGRGISVDVMSEYAMGWILHFARRVDRNAEQQASREWRMYAPSRLAGATCGILGMGAIGEAVAARAKAFGMRVLGTQRTPRPSPHADEVLGVADTARVLAESDYVVVVLPLTPETRGSIDAAMLDRLRPEAVMVNMARGGIVDEVALADKLRAGSLRGAALDVFEQEPLPAESPLWDVPNLVVTPHVAGFDRDYLPRAFEVFAENVIRLERGEPLRNEIDRSRGY